MLPRTCADVLKQKSLDNLSNLISGHCPSSGSSWETPYFFLLQTLLAAPFTWNALPLTLHRVSSIIILRFDLNVLSKKSPSWVSLSKQGLPVSLSPSTVLISFLVLSAVCSHFTLLLTCLLCREGCSLHLPRQPSLFPAGLAGVPGFMRAPTGAAARGNP